MPRKHPHQLWRVPSPASVDMRHSRSLGRCCHCPCITPAAWQQPSAQATPPAQCTDCPTCLVHLHRLLHLHECMPAAQRNAAHAGKPLHEPWLVGAKAGPAPPYIVRQQHLLPAGTPVPPHERLGMVVVQQPAPHVKLPVARHDRARMGARGKRRNAVRWEVQLLGRRVPWRRRRLVARRVQQLPDGPHALAIRQQRMRRPRSNVADGRQALDLSREHTVAAAAAAAAGCLQPIERVVTLALAAARTTRHLAPHNDAPRRSQREAERAARCDAHRAAAARDAARQLI
mmetsp:Transcript_35367/g.104598  ORF Transcript_35367/g.104598 Transcript_35367/m.104598 type:complete len:287 (-) Transcript_35367:372-1232(-)|eukprot:357907-Chlamydomonas_euryale.AAC.11